DVAGLIGDADHRVVERRVHVAERERHVLLFFLAARCLLGGRRPFRPGRGGDRVLRRSPFLGGRRGGSLGLGLLRGLGGLLGLRGGVLRDPFLRFLGVSHDSPRACALAHPFLPAGAFFFPATVLRGPLRVRAFVCVLWPRTG